VIPLVEECRSDFVDVLEGVNDLQSGSVVVLEDGKVAAGADLMHDVVAHVIHCINGQVLVFHQFLEHGSVGVVSAEVVAHGFGLALTQGIHPVHLVVHVALFQQEFDGSHTVESARYQVRVLVLNFHVEFDVLISKESQDCCLFLF